MSALQHAAMLPLRVACHWCSACLLPPTCLAAPPTGDMVRRRLAAGLQHTCEVLQRCLDISSGEVAPDTGLLAVVTGETAERIGIDSGLYAPLQPLYTAATAGGLSIQARPGCLPGLRLCGALLAGGFAVTGSAG